MCYFSEVVCEAPIKDFHRFSVSGHVFRLKLQLLRVYINAKRAKRIFRKIKIRTESSYLVSKTEESFDKIYFYVGRYFLLTPFSFPQLYFFFLEMLSIKFPQENVLTHLNKLPWRGY